MSVNRASENLLKALQNQLELRSRKEVADAVRLRPGLRRALSVERPGVMLDDLGVAHVNHGAAEGPNRRRVPGLD